MVGWALIIIVFLPGLRNKEIVKRQGETFVFPMLDPTQNSYIWTYGTDFPTQALAMFMNKALQVANGTSFGSRLEVDSKTDTLKISNLTIKDTGIFRIQILKENKTVVMDFHLTVKEDFTLNALVGTNITMEAPVNPLPPEHLVYWTEDNFGGKLIATLKDNIITYNEELKDSLYLNPQTGSLTLINITKQYSKVYCSQKKTKTFNSGRKYRLVVFDMVSTPHIQTEYSLNPWSCHLNCTVVNNANVTLSWYSEQTLVNNASDPDLSTTLELNLEIQLSQTEETYRCNASNPVSTQTIYTNTTITCPKHQTAAKISKWIIILVIVLIVLIVLIVIVSCLRKHRDRLCSADILEMPCTNTQDPQNDETENLQNSEQSTT